MYEPDVVFPTNVDVRGIVRGFIVWLHRSFPGSGIRFTNEFGRFIVLRIVQDNMFGRIELSEGFGPVSAFISLNDRLDDYHQLPTSTITLGSLDCREQYYVSHSGGLIGEGQQDKPGSVARFMPDINRAAVEWYLKTRRLPKHPKHK